MKNYTIPFAVLAAVAFVAIAICSPTTQATPEPTPAVLETMSDFEVFSTAMQADDPAPPAEEAAEKSVCTNCGKTHASRTWSRTHTSTYASGGSAGGHAYGLGIRHRINKRQARRAENGWFGIRGRVEGRQAFRASYHGSAG